MNIAFPSEIPQNLGDMRFGVAKYALDSSNASKFEAMPRLRQDQRYGATPENRAGLLSQLGLSGGLVFLVFWKQETFSWSSYPLESFWVC